MEKGCVLLIIYVIEVNGGVRLTVRLCPRLDLYPSTRAMRMIDLITKYG
jgi:hypothetical protein